MNAVRWIPTTEKDLIDAERNGLLDENILDVEFKQELPTNKKTACELASLALHGGALLVGVVDPKNRTKQQGALKPVDLEGTPERIESIASAHRIEVYPRVIPSTDDETLGYIWVDVPESPHAPHMADGRYWGRAGGSKHPLDDAQVHLYMKRRLDREDIASTELAKFASKHPSGEFHDNDDDGPTSGLHIVAIPLTPRPQMAQQLLDKHQGGYFVRDLRATIAHGLGFVEVGSPSRIADGFAYSNTELSAGRPVSGSSSFEVLEVTEGGKLRYHHHRVGAFQNNEGQRYVFPKSIAGTVRVFLELTGRLAVEMGYTGSWGTSLRIDTLTSEKAYIAKTHAYNRPAYSEPAYLASTVATTRQLQEAPHTSTKKLTGQLMRGLGIGEWNGLDEFFKSSDWAN